MIKGLRKMLRIEQFDFKFLTPKQVSELEGILERKAKRKLDMAVRDGFMRKKGTQYLSAD